MPPKRPPSPPPPGLATAAPAPKRLQITRAGFGGGGEASVEPAAPPLPSPRERLLRSTVLVLFFVVQIKGDRRHRRLRRVIRSENAIFQKKVLEEVGHAFQKHLGPIYCILESLQSRINVLSHAVEQIKRSDPNNYADQCLRSEENQEHADLVEEANQEQTTAVDEINQEQTAVFDGLTMSEAGKGAAVQLRFLNELESLVYTERGITAENGAAIKIAIYKDNHIIKSGPLSSARVEIVAIHGDFLDVVPNNWTEDEFNGRVVISQQGPVLGGDCQVKLKNGVASLGYVCFKKVSSKTDSGKLILAARVHSSDKPGLRVKEAVMNPVKVQVSRNESNKKSIRPKLKDDPSRLKGISRTGPPFKRLQGKKICTVEAFLKALNRDEDELCNECFELNKDSRSWRNIVKHAQECDLEGNHKLKSYISAEENVTLFFNCIHDLIGAKFRGNYRPKDKFDPDQQDLVNRLKKDAHNKLDGIEFDHVMEGNCLMPFSANVNIGGDVSFPTPVTSGTNPSDHPTMSQAIQCTVAVKTAHRSQINHPLELPDAFPNIGGGAMILEQSASELVPPEQQGTHGFQGDQSSGQMASDISGAGYCITPDISGAGYCITPDISGAGYCITQSSNVPLVMAEATPSTGNNLPGTIQNAVQHAIDVDFPVLFDLPIDSLLPANYESAGWSDPDFLSGNNPFEASTSTRNSLREHYFPQVQDQHMQHPLNAQNDGPGGSAYPGPGYGNY